MNTYNNIEPRTYTFIVRGVVPWLECHQSDDDAARSALDVSTTLHRNYNTVIVLHDDELIAQCTTL
jgi:hypothetical protein